VDARLSKVCSCRGVDLHTLFLHRGIRGLGPGALVLFSLSLASVPNGGVWNVVKGRVNGTGSDINVGQVLRMVRDRAGFDSAPL